MNGLIGDIAGETKRWANETDRRAAEYTAQERGYRLLPDAREVLCLDDTRKCLGLLL